MKSHVARIVLGVCLLAPAPAIAAEPMTYDCDTAAGAFSRITQPQSATAFTVSREVKALRLRTHEQWAPGATVTIDLGQGNEAPYLQLRADNGSATALNLVVGTSKTNLQDVASVPFDASVSFKVTVDQSRIRIEAGGKAFDFERPSNSKASVSVSCSTGEFLFEKLSIS